ncbi:hypothetical protein NDU88_001700 [Pleurodeles waltl]|uniref:Uncharacterized protein n=1 Tax=Pleurodeles waltl TaxID=8319 RepID=A0AAV7V8I6_PLEWA|nr:hypothetical protein NDU88_001700 [Pleurodeles waltl]
MSWGHAAFALFILGLVSIGWTPVLLLAWGVAAVLPWKLRGGGREQPQESAASGHSVTHLGRVSQRYFENEPDGPEHCEKTGVHKALEKVFACIYDQCIFVWIDAPEPAQEQPLYKALQKKLFEAIEEIKLKTVHLNRTKIMVGLINTLTSHLHRCKNNKEIPRKTILETNGKKIAFFRRYTEELITHLLPPSLSHSQHTKILLNEILALKVFKPAMETVSDPDFLNKLLSMMKYPSTAQLLPHKPSPTEITQEVPSQSPEDALTAHPNTDDENKAAAKTKKKGVRYTLKKITKKLKPSSHNKSLEADCPDGGIEISYRSNWDDSAEEEGQDGLEADGIYSDTSDTEESSNINNHMPGSDLWSSVIKMLCDEWNHGSWTATISNLQVLDDQMLTCSIHIEDQKCPAVKHWDIERNILTFLWIQNILSEDFPELNQFNIGSLLNESPTMENNIAKDTLNNFLQSLISIVQRSQNGEALFFLLPIEVSPEEEFLAMGLCDELVADGATSSSFRAFSGKPHETRKVRRAVPPGQDILPREIRKEIPILENPCEGTLKRALNQLLSEALGWSLSLFLNCTNIKDDLLAMIDEMISEGQLIAYIDILREILWPNGKPAQIPTRSSEEKQETRSKAKDLLLNFCTTIVIRDCWKTEARKLFEIFQDQNWNEELIYRWLLLLLDNVIPREDGSWTIDNILTDIRTVP